MKQRLTTWIDNTGLHSAGRALEGRGSRLDADGLLQLATLAVFSDEITLGSFEAREIFERSTDIRANLVECGLPSDSLRITDVSEGVYKRCCERAARVAAAELEEFAFERRDLPVESSPEVALYARRKKADLLSRIALPLSDAQRDALAAEALSYKAAGTVEYMLLSCSELWKRAGRREVEARTFGSEQEGSLGLRLRYYLNHELANEHSARYAPARARAMHVQETAFSVLLRLESIVAEAALKATACDKARPIHPGVPRISSAIVALAKGEPTAIPKVVTELREQASSLRRCLRANVVNADFASGEGLLKLHESMSRIHQQLDNNLGRGSVSRNSQDGLEFQVNPFAVWETLTSVSAKVGGTTLKRISAWLGAHWNARRITVLTNLTEAAAYGDHASALKRFYKECGKLANK